MMTRLRSTFFLFAFLTPVLMMGLVLASYGIYWGGPTTILASDGFHQYVIFAQALRDILQGTDSLFYSFNSGLGLNFYALISYYLGSFLSPLVSFFDLTTMADGLYLLTLVKFGLIGLSTAFSLTRLYPKLARPFVLILSTAFALMSFSTSQLEINMWLDVFILIPLIFLGLHGLTRQRRFALYYLSLTTLFIQNYYFGFMTALFISLYAPLLILEDFSWKIALRRLRDLTVVSLLATVSSSLMLLPTYLDLTSHGETLSPISQIFTDNSWWLDIFAKNLVGSYDTTQFGAIPMIYVGLLPASLALLYFRLKAFSIWQRVGQGLVLLLILASFYLEPLDLLWQGLHTPNMFLHRYAWIWSFLLIQLAAKALTRLEDLTWKDWASSLGFWTLGLSATLYFPDQYPYLEINQLIFSLAFLAAYAIIFISYQQKQLSKPLMLGAALLFCLLELGLNSYHQIAGIAQEWAFPSRVGYLDKLTETQSLVASAKSDSLTFSRLEVLQPRTGNDGLFFNYPGISQFSSVRNRKSSSLLDKLGFQSTGTNLNLRYQNNSLIADSLFALGYNISSETLYKYGFSQLETQGKLTLYKNDLGSQLAILTPKPYEDVKLSLNILDNQTKLLNRLSGLRLNYYTRLTPVAPVQGGTSLNNSISAQSLDGKSTQVSYQLNLPGQSQIYVKLPSITFANEASKEVTIRIGERTSSYTTDNTYYFFDLGYQEQAQTLTVTLTFPDNKTISFSSPEFYALNIPNYQTAMKAIQTRPVTVQTSGNQVHISYQSQDKTSLFVSLPYDKGWTATDQTGKSIPIRPAQEGLMAVDIPAGQGQVTLTFVPQGFYLGLGLSVLGVVGFIAYAWIVRRKKSA